MKKRIFFLVVLGVLFLNIPVRVNAEEDLISNAKSGLLMEISTGNILYEKNIHEQVAVASMTKMMSQILILEAVEDGKIKWDDKLQVSKNAADFGGSQIWLTAGEIMTVKDLMKGVSMASANDATVALAEYISGTEEEFVKKMNAKAKELGLKNTNFVNSTGLDVENHYSSSYDLALIARHLLLEHPNILEFSSVYEDYLRVDTPNKFWLVNTNKLVRFYEGADGLKTGHTDAAKYCMAVTSKRSDMRLLAVLLGEETAAIRNEETSKLLDYGFNNYKIQLLKNKKETVKEIKINKANQDKVAIIPKDDVSILLRKNENQGEYTYETNIKDLKLPIKNGDTVGKLIVKTKEGKPIKEVDLTVDKNVSKISFLKLWSNFIRSIITGD